MSTTVFTADADEATLAQANEVLAREGMTLTDALHQMMNYIVAEGRMPHFQCYEPNEETLAAIAEAESGDLITVGTVADLMAELNEDDQAHRGLQRNYRREKRRQYRHRLQTRP